MNRIPIFSYLFSALFLTAMCTMPSCQSGPAEATTWKYTDNTVRVRLGVEPDRLNPLLSRSAYSRMVNEQIFEPLMDYNPLTLDLEPVLLEAAPEKKVLTEGPFAGGMQFDMVIKDAAKWGDGTPVTAADVAFTIKLIFTPGLPTGVYRPYYEFFKKIKIDPDNPKRFTVFTANQYMLNEAALVTTPIYPRQVYDTAGILVRYSLADLNKPDIDKILGEDPAIKQFSETFTSPQFSRERKGIKGSGPYVFDTWQTGQYIRLKKKQNWWGDAFASRSPLFEAYPDEILYKIIPDQSAALTALKDQELDAITTIDARDFTRIKENPIITENYNLYTPPAPQIYLMYLNNKNPKLADKRVRRALAHLMDVDEFIQSLYFGLATRVTGPILKSKAYYNDTLAPIPYDPAKAKELLSAAGWEDTNGNGIRDKIINGERRELQLEIAVTSAKASQNMALFFQNSLKKAGIQADIVTKEFRELIGNVRQKKYEIYPGAMGLDLTLDDLKQQWHTESDHPSGGNYTGFASPQTDSLIEKIRTTTNEAERKRLYREFQAILYEETPAIFLFTPQEKIAIHKRFEAEVSLKRPGIFPNSFKLKKPR